MAPPNDIGRWVRGIFVAGRESTAIRICFLKIVKPLHDVGCTLFGFPREIIVGGRRVVADPLIKLQSDPLRFLHRKIQAQRPCRKYQAKEANRKFLWASRRALTSPDSHTRPHCPCRGRHSTNRDRRRRPCRSSGGHRIPALHRGHGS